MSTSSGLPVRKDTIFRAATSQDEPAIAALVEATPSQGPISSNVRFPMGFVRGLSLLTDAVQVVVAERCGSIIAVGVRALRRHFVNGRVEDGGYLGELRIHPHHRRGVILCRAYEHLRELDLDGKARLYSSVIREDNQVAIDMLTSGRAGLPNYTDLGRIHVYAVSSIIGSNDDAIAVRPGTLRAVPAIVKCLNARPAQLARAYRSRDLHGKGLLPRKFYMAGEPTAPLGTMALWDQRRVRELHIVTYPALLQVVGSIGGYEGLMAPVGVPLPIGHVACVSACDVNVFRALMRRVCQDLPTLGLRSVLVGLHERDPRRRVLEEGEHTQSYLRLYAVSFAGKTELDGSLPFFDVALV